MAFLDETGLAELWSLITAEDDKLAAADVKIATGSYSGTGKYGSGNPTSLTFDFAPVYFEITGSSSNGSYQAASTSSAQPGKYSMDAITTSYVGFDGNNYQYMKKSADGKTISWYGKNTSQQYNDSGRIYYYIAIG